MSYGIDEEIRIRVSQSMLDKIRELAQKHGYKNVEHLGRFIFQMWYETHREKQK